MASTIVELFGFHPHDQATPARNARARLECPFLGQQCVKTLSDGLVSGACTLKPMRSGPVICCPIRLYANDYRILQDVAFAAFGSRLQLVAGNSVTETTGECIAVFGKRWGGELRLPMRGNTGAYSVDWVLAHLDGARKLLSFVAVEVQSIDTTGNYRIERETYLANQPFAGASSAGFNWENVNKRILPQIIYKGHVLRQEPLCKKGLFFVCPTPVYAKISERLGGGLRAYPIQPGSLTIAWYDIGPIVSPGVPRDLIKGGLFTTTIDQIALAFTAPSNLPPSQAYEKAILQVLGQSTA